MEFQYQLTADDVRQALRDVYVAGLVQRLARLAVFVVAGISLGMLAAGATRGHIASAADLLSDGWPDILLIAALSVLVLSLANYFLHIPRRAEKLYRQTKSMHLQKNVGAEERGLRVRDDNGDSLIPWDHIHKWRETSRYLIVYLSDYVFFIPKQALDGPSNVGRLRSMFNDRALRP